MSVRLLISLIFTGFLLAGCGLGNLQVLQKFEPRGDAFQKALAKEYREFAESQEQKRDLIDAQYFAKKGLMAAKGQNVAPEKIENWSISREVKPTILQARGYLLEVLTPEITARVPNDAARIQLLFDCWLEQQENADNNQIPPCREEFYDLLDTMYTYKTGTSSLAPLTNINVGKAEDEYIATGGSGASVQPDVQENPNLTFTVYFDTNSTVLKKAAEAKITEVAQKVRKLKGYEVVVSGHTDRAGTKSYNVGLSQRRAETVKKALVGHGLDAKRISAFGYGELYPKVQTGDGVRNRANRRVHIVIRDKTR